MFAICRVLDKFDFQIQIQTTGSYYRYTICRLLCDSLDIRILVEKFNFYNFLIRVFKLDTYNLQTISIRIQNIQHRNLGLQSCKSKKIFKVVFFLRRSFGFFIKKKLLKRDSHKKLLLLILLVMRVNIFFQLVINNFVFFRVELRCVFIFCFLLRGYNIQSIQVVLFGQSSFLRAVISEKLLIIWIEFFLMGGYNWNDLLIIRI
eukprot:TRINITY_DN999_c0_g2_i1.p1 TRINITY_DN999_c0_g2~~TRINITY_DN999_c0_g2_i1.p1  ORF type:complete len:204 (+),score=-5.76 TRINITY_DN999_c0_g2_i1:218-829(+)